MDDAAPEGATFGLIATEEFDNKSEILRVDLSIKRLPHQGRSGLAGLSQAGITFPSPLSGRS